MKRIFFPAICSLTILSQSLAQEFLSLPASDFSVLNGEVPEVTTAISVSVPTEGKYRVQLLYPEYLPLTASEIKALKRLDYTPPTSIALQQKLAFDIKKPLCTLVFILSFEKKVTGCDLFLAK